MKSERKTKRKGFTLIELSFAIAFISVLLITVTLITNEIVSIYRKGYAIKLVNQVGRELITDIQSSISQSPPAAISSFCKSTYEDDEQQQLCLANNGFYSVYQQYYAEASIKNGDDSKKQVPIGGIFCTGKNTYIWNSGYLFNGDNDYTFSDDVDNLKLSVTYPIDGTDDTNTITNFRMLKIEDNSKEICASTLKKDEDNLMTKSTYPSVEYPLVAPGISANMATAVNPNREIVVPYPLSEEPDDIIRESDASLAIFDLVVFEPAHVTNSNRLLYSGSFILGTTNGSVDIMASSDYCKTPTNYISADFSYCAINKFNFTIQSTGE